jgi:hypothetical protein
MSESTAEMLAKQVDYAAERIAEYARQIESGDYGNRWTVTDSETDEEHVIIAQDEDSAIDAVRDLIPGVVKDHELLAERDEFEVPTICDEDGNEESIEDWPLAVVVKIGQPLAVQIAVGGPHIEIVQDLSEGSAKLAGYWGGERVYRYGDKFQTVLDYFTDLLWDEAPEEYK